MEENIGKRQRGIQILVVLPRKVTVIIVGFALELVVKLDAGAASCSTEMPILCVELPPN